MKKENGDATPYVPESRSYATLKKASKRCHGCHLYKDATQTVFGKGPRDAKIILVGEQPGNSEDLAGEPFVGPAGGILHKALAEAGIELKEVYVTNAVKHFKFSRVSGKRRLHEKPNASEVRACKPWLAAEIEMIKPEIIVCLGATATGALLGTAARVRRDRGKPIESEWAEIVIVTEHPSAILRAPDHESRERGFQNLINDLKVAARELRQRHASGFGERVTTGSSRGHERKSPSARRREESPPTR